MGRDRIRSAVNHPPLLDVACRSDGMDPTFTGWWRYRAPSTHRRTRADNCQSDCRASPQGTRRFVWAEGRMLPLPLKGLGSLAGGMGVGVVVAYTGFPCKMASTRAPRNAVRMYNDSTDYEAEENWVVCDPRVEYP